MVQFVPGKDCNWSCNHLKWNVPMDSFQPIKIIHSTNDGQLIRTKRSDLTSGGLMNGAATINSLHVTP